MTEKKYKISLVLFGLIAIASFGAGSIANASVCGNALQGQIISAGYAGGQATASATNNSPDCTAQVTFSSYKMPVQMSQPDWLDAQILFDSQTLTLAPGETKTFAVNNPDCKTQLDLYEGPVQPHLSDAASGFPGQNLLAWNINTYPVCGNNPPPQLTCSPASQNVNVGASANFSATGGTGVYSWNGGGAPASGSGSGFSTSFGTSGTKTVTVTSGAQMANCQVNVAVIPPPPTLTCTPAEQGAEQNQNVNFSAAGGTGIYSWSAPTGAPSFGGGSSFTSQFVTAGWNTVTVYSGSQTATCRVTILPPPDFPLVCNSANQNVNVGETAAFTASWGGGNYTWNSPGVPSSGSGANFSSVFSTPGAKTVSVSDGNHAANCSVTVNQVPLSCSPSTQNAGVGATLNFSAVGGNGSYSWNTGNGSPASGSGAAFSTNFATAGSKTITVTSAGQTATCGATITQTTCNLPQTWLTATTNVGQNSATLNGYVDPQGQTATYYFEYGTGTGYGQRTADQTVTSGQNVSATITGLQPYALYYFHLVVQSSCGTNQTQAWTFQTPGNPTPPYQPPYYPPYNPPYYPPYNPPAYNPPVVCGPQNQNVQVGDWVSFWTSGGNGSYSWSSSYDANPNSGSGSGFGTRFTTTGQKIVTVYSNTGGSSQCTVNVNPKGTVLGAADIVTGPEDAWPISLVLGLFAAALAYYFYFRPRLALKSAAQALPSRIRVIEAAPLVEKPKRKTELEKLLEQIKTGEQAPDA